jgi:hypothetical protein
MGVNGGMAASLQAARSGHHPGMRIRQCQNLLLTMPAIPGWEYANISMGNPNISVATHHTATLLGDFGHILVCNLANISMRDVSMISQHEATPSWYVQSHINSFINVTLGAFFQKCTHAPCWYVLTTKGSPCAEISPPVRTD